MEGYETPREEPGSWTALIHTPRPVHTSDFLSWAFWGISFHKHLVLPFVTCPLAVQQSSWKESRIKELGHKFREGTNDGHQGLVQRRVETTCTAQPGQAPRPHLKVTSPTSVKMERENQALESTWQSLAAHSEQGQET